MAAPMYDFEETRKNFQNDIRLCLYGEDISLLKNSHSLAAGSEQERNFAMDIALRDAMFELMSSKSTCKEYTQLVNLSVETVSADMCTASCPFIMLSDILDCLTLDKCAEVFAYIEERLEKWKTAKFQSAGKNYLLRMCNDLLRRLSKSQNTLFCGRIQVFLARLFPLTEKSGVNLYSHFNVENMTVYKTAEDYEKTRKQSIEEKDKDEAMEVEEGEMKDQPGSTIPVDYELYRQFWMLQDYFRRPTQCYEKKAWALFQSNSEKILNCFESHKLDDTSKTSSRRKHKEKGKGKDEHSTSASGSGTSSSKEVAYFAKYLTSEKLLDLQLSDSNFRRYVLVQHVILFQYLNATVKFKQSQHVLSDDQGSWIKASTDRVYTLMKETPPDGEQFAHTIQHILSREENWNTWKNNECQSYVNGKNDNKDVLHPTRKRTAVTADLIDPNESSGEKHILMGKDELTRLWNISHDNMAACRDSNRAFFPSTDNFFANAYIEADKSQQVDEEYKLINKENWCWKALRLLSRTSIHFCISGNTTKSMREFLELIMTKMEQDKQGHQKKSIASSNGSLEATPTQTQDTEDLDEAETLEDDTDMSAAVKTGEITKVSDLVADKWTKLGEALQIDAEDVEYYATQGTDHSTRCSKMLTVWAENVTSTRETLVNALKTVEEADIALKVFNLKKVD